MVSFTYSLNIIDAICIPKGFPFRILSVLKIHSQYAMLLFIFCPLYPKCLGVLVGRAFLGTFSACMFSPFYIPDSQSCTICPVLHGTLLQNAKFNCVLQIDPSLDTALMPMLQTESESYWKNLELMNEACL
jgi:hypothetical protein